MFPFDICVEIVETILRNHAGAVILNYLLKAIIRGQMYLKRKFSNIC